MEFRIHLGAHKTATTQFQDILEIAFRDNLQGNVKYFPRDFLRRKKFVKYGVNVEGAPHIQRFLRGYGLYRKPLLDAFVADFEEGARVLISEENILGGVDDLLRNFYDGAGNKLVSLGKMIRNNPVRVYLSVRNYADILPSAYCQSLRGGAKYTPFEDYKNGFLGSRRGWSLLVDEILKVFSREDVTVWTFETYTKNPLAIVEMFSGVELQFDEEIPQSEQVTRLTTGQVSEIQKHFQNSNRKISTEKMRQILSANKDGDLFSPLSSEEKNLMSIRYHRDLDRIRELGVKVI